MISAVNAGEAEAVEFYNSWVEQVKATVPKDRLLVRRETLNLRSVTG